MILHLVTDRLRLAGGAVDASRTADSCLRLQARYAIDAGVDVLQVRERDMEAAALAELVTDLVALARGSRTRIVVNDRTDVALACGAAGVHLRGDSVAAHAVRAIAPHGFLIGRSVHRVDEVPHAGADYLIAGTVFSSASKREGHQLLGLDGLAAIVGAAQVPVLAIGGVGVARLGEVAASGARGVAAIGLFMRQAQSAAAEECRAMPLADIVRAARGAFDTSRTAS